MSTILKPFRFYKDASLRITHDGKRIITTSNGSAKLIDLESNNVIYRAGKNKSCIIYNISPADKTYATMSGEEELVIKSVETLQTVAELKLKGGSYMNDVFYVSENTVCISGHLQGSFDNTSAELWNFETGERKELFKLDMKHGRIEMTSYSDGKYCIFATDFTGRKETVFTEKIEAGTLFGFNSNSSAGSFQSYDIRNNKVLLFLKKRKEQRTLAFYDINNAELTEVIDSPKDGIFNEWACWIDDNTVIYRTKKQCAGADFRTPQGCFAVVDINTLKETYYAERLPDRFKLNLSYDGKYVFCDSATIGTFVYEVIKE